MSAAADTLTAIQAKFPQATARASADHAALNVPLADALTVLQSLRDDFAFDFLCDVTAIDWAEGASPRFTVVYHLYSTTKHEYVRVAAPAAGDENPVAPSAVPLWPAADWHERECYDLLGVKFTGHPDLRRILMWDGYPYHPLRKEFPLAGLPADLPGLDVQAETGTRLISAPMAGGPFVASAGEMNLTDAEPRAKDESWNERKEKPEA